MPKALNGLEFYSGIGEFQDLNSISKQNISNILYPNPNHTWKSQQQTVLPALQSYLSDNSSLPSTFPQQRDNIQKNRLINETNDSNNKEPASLPFIDILDSFEINTVANDVYEYNFGKRPKEGLIEDLTASFLDTYKPDIFLMSPPCQPYTRGGLQKDTEDNRSSSFLHLLLNLLPSMKHPPKYILLENVQCFESSNSCSIALTQLRSLGYICDQFLLSPRQFGIPNQRSRFFLLATKIAANTNTDLLSDSNHIMSYIPNNIHFSTNFSDKEKDLWNNADNNFSRVYCALPPPLEKVLQSTSEELQSSCTTDMPILGKNITVSSILINTHIPTVLPPSLHAFLENDTDFSPLTKHNMTQYLAGSDTKTSTIALDDSIQNLQTIQKEQNFQILSASALVKPSSWCIDIVLPQSHSTTCFTKAYYTFLRGSGSILQTKPQEITISSEEAQAYFQQFVNDPTIKNPFPEIIQSPLYERGLRYFTPREIANLHFFPPSYKPMNSIQKKRTITDLRNKNSSDLPSHDIKKKKLSKSERISLRNEQGLVTASKGASNGMKCSPFDSITHFEDNFMCFSFPDHITQKQKYKMLGNSLNIYVVSQLLLHLIQPEFEKETI